MSGSPWSIIKPPSEVIDLQNIMSEELAKDLQVREDQKLAKIIAGTGDKNPNQVEEIPAELLNEVPCDSDEVIANMLQLQYDREFNSMLDRSEQKVNGHSKVSISFSNYRRNIENISYDDDEEDDCYDDGGEFEKKDWDRFETVEKEFQAIPRCGYKMQSGEMITKHDMTMAGRRNAGRVMSLPLEIQTGDGAGFDMRLPNKVYNSIKRYAHSEDARRQKHHDKKKEQATSDMAFDEKTSLLLFKLLNKGLLTKRNGIISTGKEAVVIHADSDISYTDDDMSVDFTMPDECAVKVFKTTLNEFKNRDKYIRDDNRFKDRLSTQNPRKTIHLWAEKEMHNLKRMQKIGIACPQVVCLCDHVLVMSFIGKNGLAAPKLKDAPLKPKTICTAYDQVIDTMEKLYKDARLVHADLSEYNILWHENKCWFIDVSQAVEHCHPSAFDFLLRDCRNISTFFTKKGVPEVASAEELFLKITGLESIKSIEKERIKPKCKPHMVNRADYEPEDMNDFDHSWNESQTHLGVDDFVESLKHEIEQVPLVEPPQS